MHVQAALPPTPMFVPQVFGGTLRESAPSSMSGVDGLRAHPPHSEPTKPLLLQVSQDMPLAHTRQLLLENAGFAVRSCSPHHAPALLEELAAAVRGMLLCQTLAPEPAVQLSRLLCDKNVSALLIRFTAQPWREYSAYDQLLQTPVAPGMLVRAMAALQDHGHGGSPPASSPLRLKEAGSHA